MAKMRNHAAVRSTAGWADWRQVDTSGPCPICPWNHPDTIRHVAPLENGHELHAWSYDDDGGTPEDYGWSWAVVDPSKYPAEPNKYSGHVDPEHHLLTGGDDGSDDGDYIPTLDEAKSRAEAAYQKHVPLGTDTGTHDSGVDYSDLNQLMRDQGF